MAALQCTTIEIMLHLSSHDASLQDHRRPSGLYPPNPNLPCPGPDCLQDSILSTILQTPRQIPHTRQTPRTIRPPLDHAQKIPKPPHRQIQNLAQPHLQRRLPLHARQGATLAPDPRVPIGRLRSRRRHLQQFDQCRVRVCAGVETVFGDQGCEEGGRCVWDARVDGCEDGFGGGVGGEGGGPGGDVVLEGVDVPGAVPFFRCLCCGVLCAVSCRRLRTQGGAQG